MKLLKKLQLNLNYLNMKEHNIIVYWIDWDIKNEIDKSSLPNKVNMSLPLNLDDITIYEYIENTLSNKYWFTINWFESFETIK